MRRSEIRRAIEEAEALFARAGFRLPPFARWTRSDWERIGSEADEIRTRKLGWDVTDFNLGTFDQKGLTLFTVRNGLVSDPENRKVYAEKIMYARDGQVTPLHFHEQKTEDIINRAGATLVIELYNSTPGGKLDDSTVVVQCDGVRREVKAGGVVELGPGESITLTPRVYHAFYPRGGSVMIGEVSSVNDDSSDNFFLEPLPRYPSIEEDEPAGRLLCWEYPAGR